MTVKGCAGMTVKRCADMTVKGCADMTKEVSAGDSDTARNNVSSRVAMKKHTKLATGAYR